MQSNVATFHGNLVADPVMRKTASGLTVANFRLASNNRRYDASRNEWVDGDTVFISVTCWRQLATNVGASLRKGHSVVVHGRITFREYKDGKGVDRSVHELDAQSISADLNRCQVNVIRPQRDPQFAPIEPSVPADPHPVPDQAPTPADHDPNPWTESRPAETAA